MTDNRGKKKFRRALTELNALKEYDPDLIRQMQEGFCEAVDDHVTWLRIKGVPDLLLSDEPKGEQIDVDMLLWLQNALTDVLAGHKSDFLEPTTSKGSGLQSERSLKKKLIKDAVFYRYCVKEGLIRDPEPLKTIALSYGVGNSDVQKWLQDQEFHDVNCHDPKNPPDANCVRSLLEIHGEMYRKLFSSLKYRK